jgi:hypothetical protein
MADPVDPIAPQKASSASTTLESKKREIQAQMSKVQFLTCLSQLQDELAAVGDAFSGRAICFVGPMAVLNRGSHGAGPWFISKYTIGTMRSGIRSRLA